MDTRNVEIMFNATKYFEIKQYVKEQPLTLTYQDPLDEQNPLDNFDIWSQIPRIHNYNRDLNHSHSQMQNEQKSPPKLQAPSRSWI